jgi:hypothetical protein
MESRKERPVKKPLRSWGIALGTSTWPQHIATTKNEDPKCRRILDEFATAVEQLAHRAYPALLKDHIRREAGKAFADGVEDTTIKIQLLLGGEKTVNEVLRQVLELQAMLQAARPQKQVPGHSGGTDLPQLGEVIKDDWHAGAVESHANSG